MAGSLQVSFDGTDALDYPTSGGMPYILSDRISAVRVDYDDPVTFPCSQPAIVSF